MRASRREVLRGGGLALGGALVGSAGTAAALRPGAGRPARERPWYDLDIIGDPVADNQLLWYLSQVGQGQAEVGECLATAKRIDPTSDVSWFEAWWATAERVRGIARESAAGGHDRSAGEAYLRAANYYRAALIHFARPADPRMQRACHASVECYERALSLLALPARAVRIPYEGTTLPGHFWRSPVASDPAPLLILHQGLHAWPEETKWVADAAVDRGYHALLFHGPGQGLPLRLEGLPFRPDWENVVTPVVDHALTLPGVDPDRIALMGLSFGGALAPRAVAFEKRIKVCIANPGVLSWSDAILGRLKGFPGLLEVLESDSPLTDAVAKGMAATMPSYAWGMADITWKYGARSPSEALRKIRLYDNTEIVDRIECHVLIMDGTAEDASPGEARRLQEALRSPVDYLLFTEEDTGLVHCQAGATAVAAQRLFDWLDGYL